MTEQSAREVAERIVLAWFHDKSRGGEVRIDHVAMIGLCDYVASALLAAAQVPEGCVRLPDGRDVRVLGELPMTSDQCVIGDECRVWAVTRPDEEEPLAVYEAEQGNCPDGEPPFRRWWELKGYGAEDAVSVIGVYSTRAAAEAAATGRKEKETR